MTTAGTKARGRAKKASASAPSRAYLALIRAFPLRPLRTAADYDQAVSVVDALAVRPKGGKG